MNAAHKYDVIIPGSGTGGKSMAQTMAQERMRTAVVDRRYIGGSCLNIARPLSNNVIHTAKVASAIPGVRDTDRTDSGQYVRSLRTQAQRWSTKLSKMSGFAVMADSSARTRFR